MLPVYVGVFHATSAPCWPAETSMSRKALPWYRGAFLVLATFDDSRGYSPHTHHLTPQPARWTVGPGSGGLKTAVSVSAHLLPRWGAQPVLVRMIGRPDCGKTLMLFSSVQRTRCAHQSTQATIESLRSLCLPTFDVRPRKRQLGAPIQPHPFRIRDRPRSRQCLAPPRPGVPLCSH